MALRGRKAKLANKFTTKEMSSAFELKYNNAPIALRYSTLVPNIFRHHPLDEIDHSLDLGSD